MEHGIGGPFAVDAVDESLCLSPLLCQGVLCDGIKERLLNYQVIEVVTDFSKEAYRLQAVERDASSRTLGGEGGGGAGAVCVGSGTLEGLEL